MIMDNGRYEIIWADFYDAQKNWIRLYGTDADFKKFLGWDTSWGTKDISGITVHWEEGRGTFLTIPEKMYSKIRILKSPHYRAMMRAFIIKTGYHRKKFINA